MRTLDLLQDALVVVGAAAAALLFAAALVALAPLEPYAPVLGAGAVAAVVAFVALRPLRHAAELEAFAQGRTSFLRVVTRKGYAWWDREDVPRLVARLVRMELAAVLALTVLYAVITWGYARLHPGAFAGALDSPLGWGLFAIDGVAESLLFDLPAVYDVHLVDVRPVTFGAKTIVFGFRLVISVLAIQGVLAFFSLRRRIIDLVPRARRRARD